MRGYWTPVILTVVFVVAFVVMGIVSTYVNGRAKMDRYQKRLYLKAMLEDRLKKENQKDD